MMIAAIYARKSTSQADVADEVKSVTRQIDGARAFISSREWTLDDTAVGMKQVKGPDGALVNRPVLRHIYEDDGVSGALFATRPEYQRMMRDAAAGAFDALVFYDLDRFGRDGHKTMVALNALLDLGIQVWDSSTNRQIDLGSFETRLPTILRAEFAQQEREQARKRTKAAMRYKAEAGYVTGGKLFGYDNLRVGKGQTRRVINDAEAGVVRVIYERFAAGDGLRTIALALNKEKKPSPRAQQGRPNGWSSSSVREVLGRSAYRGEAIYGRTANAYGSEVTRAIPKATREHAQLPQPEERWVLVPVPRIVDADLAARVDQRRQQWRQRSAEAKVKGRAPQKAGGKYLLSGGLLICPTCGGHFEAFKAPWRPEGIYCCATRRRKPGKCTNGLTLPMRETDETILEMIDGEVLGTPFIEELLALVDKGEADQTAMLTAERDRLQREVNNLLDLVASGISADTIAPKIREREKEIATLDARLRRPRPERPNIDHLRAALEQRAADWKRDLRSEPQVARVLLRRLVGPLTLFDPADAEADVEWETLVNPAILEGLTPIQVVASPPGFEGLLPVIELPFQSELELPSRLSCRM
jgi:site-specific DNA recombinase